MVSGPRWPCGWSRAFRGCFRPDGGGGAVRRPGRRDPRAPGAGRGQDASLEARIDEITAVGAELEEAQSRVDNARARAGELGEQTRSLERDLATQRKSFETAKAGYEEKARAAYKGGDLESLSSLLGGMLGSTESLASVADRAWPGSCSRARRAWTLIGVPRSPCATHRARSPRKGATTRPRYKKRRHRPQSCATASRISGRP